MKTVNPYAPPQSEVERLPDVALPNADIQRDGKFVVFPVETEYFPDRCVRCAGECAGYQRRAKLIWTPRHIYYVFIVCLLAWLFLPMLIASIPGSGYPSHTTEWLMVLTYVLSLGGMMLSVIWALIARRRVRLSLGLCHRHRWQRLVGWVLAVAGVVGLPLWVLLDRGSMLPVILVTFLVWAIVLCRWSRPPLRIDHLDGDLVFAKGCGKAFLDTLAVYDRRELNRKNKQ